MNISDTIRQAREARGLTQEDLAEKCEVSRQAVSKWEVGASLPTPENLKTLGEILEVTFETEESAAVPAAPSREKNPWKTAVIALGVLMLAALLSIGMYVARVSGTDVPQPMHPVITGIDFFSEDGTPLDPDLGDGWKQFTVGQRVYLLVSFRQGTENGVHGISLFATPTGTETYDQREQLGLQAVYDRTFALFPLDFPDETMVHLDITLECDGEKRVTETLNVTAVPAEIGGLNDEFNRYEDMSQVGPVNGETLDDDVAMPASP